ncbi:MAG: 30S ribosomal protein S3, partial [Candidatus Brennerbacteria bacterium]|nr:30S ribosomal protein S3 [Candidatus Brennerbacteria bacterium]
MGHKIRPDSFRLGITKNWSNRWFVKKDRKEILEEDLLIRDIIKEKINQAGIDSVEIERKGNITRVNIKAAKPGLVIGRGGKGIEDLKKSIEKSVIKLNLKKQRKPFYVYNLNVEELRRSEISASVIAQNIAWDLEKRLPFRRTMKHYIDLIHQSKDIKGVKIKMAGRLDGNEIARSEWLAKGRMPLQ